MAIRDKCLRRRSACLFLLLFLVCPSLRSQVLGTKTAPVEAPSEAPKDALGRTTPRGAVMGFLNAARHGNAEIAALYLNTSLRGEDAQALARQLAVVLDRRLPPRLNTLSDEPEGSLRDPLRPDEDVIGTIETDKGPLDVVLERVDRGKLGRVWLFSRKTLQSIPDAYDELSTPAIQRFLPNFLVEKRLGGIQLFEWLAVLVGLPFLYFMTGLLNRVISGSIGAALRRLRRAPDLNNPQILPPPLRLLLLAWIIRWLLSRVGLPLLARQFWSTATVLIATAGCVWLIIVLNGWGERYLVRRRPSLTGSSSVIRLFRRVLDGVALFAGLLFTLYHFGVNPTAALAGLGVGGIAIALAAQKTLENVIAGVSLIADQAVRVGDFLKAGDIQGTVEEIGLRSTRIRTLDRTIVSLPNGQIANMSLETFSARDKFWFHPVIGLRYETTAAQLRLVRDGIRDLLNQHSRADSASVRVRFLRFGPSSLDLEIVAYISASDWSEFLAIQEELLLGVMDIVERTGTEIAFPSQTMYLAADSTQSIASLVGGNGGKSGRLPVKHEQELHH